MSDIDVTECNLRRYSVKQVADMLGGRSEPFVTGLIHSGKLLATKEGRLFFISAEALATYLDSLPLATNAS